MNANPLYDRARLGRLQHAVIQLAAQECGRFPTQAELEAVIVEAVRQSVDAPAHRIALKAHLKALAARYATEFTLPEGTRLVGREVAVSGARLDLLWRLPGGRLLADELKSSGLSSAFDKDLVLAQLVRQLAGATARYGEAFRGVRLVCLVTPQASLLLQADGRIGSLEDTEWLR